MMLTRRAFLASAAALATAPARAQAPLPLRVGYVPVIGASALGSGGFRDVVQDQ